MNNQELNTIERKELEALRAVAYEFAQMQSAAEWVAAINDTNDWLNDCTNETRELGLLNTDACHTRCFHLGKLSEAIVAFSEIQQTAKAQKLLADHPQLWAYIV